ncbi:MAG: GntR family transcriptional regulator [Anaerolineae bacterium]|nr:GntR family transcriptional regulator [Anaerolineae bacterium]
MSRNTRAQAAASQLRGEILGGVYLSGERLRELAVAGRLQVSQSTVRDALALLEREGWVVSTPRHGTAVRAFTPAEADDVYRLIGVLAPLAFEWVVDAARKPRLREIAHFLDEARAAAGDEQTIPALAALIGWLGALAEIADRPVTGELLAGLLRRAHIIELVREARAPLPLPELSALAARHVDVQRALGMGDYDLACRLYAPVIETLRAAAVVALAVG